MHGQACLSCTSSTGEPPERLRALTTTNVSLLSLFNLKQIESEHKLQWCLMEHLCHSGLLQGIMRCQGTGAANHAIGVMQQ